MANPFNENEHDGRIETYTRACMVYIIESVDGAFYIFTRYIVGLTPFLGSNIEHSTILYLFTTREEER